MGVVFKAEDTKLNRMVALKIMKPDQTGDSKARQRFLMEGKSAASIQHDHIVTIYQVDEDRGIPFLAMQYLEGESLERRLKIDRVFGVADILRVGREVAGGLAAAHDRGLIHRDIKPANIWLEPATSSGCGRVKILDFGLARIVGDQYQHLTQTGFVMGTPGFMAPEQARGLELDGRCDLFSLGCVLYQMCTGMEPFRGSDMMGTLMALALEHPAPIRSLNPAVPPALAELVSWLLAKSPGDRPRSARVVIDTIANIEKNLASFPTAGPHLVPAAASKAKLLEPGLSGSPRWNPDALSYGGNLGSEKRSGAKTGGNTLLYSVVTVVIFFSIVLYLLSGMFNAGDKEREKQIKEKNVPGQKK
jgi:serine/threonine protein kinase